MAEPVVIQCPGSCTVTVVHELSLPPLQLTLEEGAMVAAAIVGVWTVGLAFRLLIRVLNADTSMPAPDLET